MILLTVSFLWLLSYAIFYYVLALNMKMSSFLALIISVVCAELLLSWAKRYVQRQSTAVAVPNRITSPFYIPVKHDPNAFDKIVGMARTIEVLKDALELPLNHPELIKQYGLKPGSGLLLYGAPGTGKTAIIRAASSYFGMTFFLVNASSVSSNRVGDTEKAIREVFAEAKTNAPSIIFFDEIDAIGRRRDNQHLNRPSDLALNSLLTELDGFVSREGGINC